MWDRFKKNRPSSADGVAPALAGSILSAGAESSVRQLIANGKYKIAVEAAKEIHKATHSAASEALLVDAYAARIRGLFDQHLAQEAKALRELVLERYRSARERLNGREVGAFDELVRPLNDPELSAERRTAIETALMRETGDLGALAGCEALPEVHPLRQAASALQRAFLAVTEGPVTEEVVELPEVSRRSPLASWKMLVRAIACFYRGQDEACRQYLSAIKPESAPARLVPAMQAMLGGKPAGLTSASSALIASTTSNPAGLRKSLEALDKAFEPRKEAAILKAIREVLPACREIAPDQIEKLKQHISVRCALLSFNVEKVKAAVGGTSRHDAYFCRLFARGMEELGEPENIAMACATWEEFRQHAVREGWFTANGPEVATLYLHMAGVLRKLPHQILWELQRATIRKGQASAEELYFLYPEKLYERASALDPHFETFSHWLDWAKDARRGQAERVAEAWHKIRPMDIEPILLLIEEKEKRSAFHTSLQYLSKAERIDSVHPAVRRARLRLLARSTLRHLQQKKLHLAEEKLAEMETLPQAQQGDRPAYLAALRYLVSTVGAAEDRAAAHRADVERAIGSPAAALVIFSLANAAKLGAIEKLPPVGTLGKAERAALPEAVIRVVELSRDMQMGQQIPQDWMQETAKQFPAKSQDLDVRQLQTLAEASLCAKQLELTYAVSAAGLERGGTSEASFLLVRARSLPQYGAGRWAVCAVAAAQLARQQRQMDVVEKAVELLADSPLSDFKLTTEQAATVVQKEKKERAFPTPYRPGPDYSEFFEDGLCDCPDCRRARGEAVSPFEEFDDEDDDDFDEIFNELPPLPGVPPDVAKILAQEMVQAIQRGESFDSMLNRVLGPGFGGKRKKGRQR